jgi:hypothetical protein
MIYAANRLLQVGSGSSITTSRALKKSFATGLQDGVIAVAEGQFDFDGAVVFEFGRT